MNKRLKRFIFKVFCFSLIICIGIILCLNCSYFNLNKIYVYGNKQLKYDYIVSVSGINIGQNILKLNPKDAEKNLKQDQYVDSVDVTRKFPNKVVIRIKERKIQGFLVTNNQLIGIDKNGYVLKILAYDSTKTMSSPIIEGLDFQEVSIGKKLKAKYGQVFKIVMNFLNLLKKYNYSYKIKELNVSDLDRITLEDKLGRKILFGDSENLDYKIRFIEAILRNVKSNEKFMIDFSNPKRPLLKPGQY